MPREDTLGGYLRGFRRRTAELHPGTVDEIIGGGVYRVLLDRTGATTRASVSQAGATFRVGQSVLLSRIDASGVAPNGGWTILGPAAIQNRSDAAPYSTTRSKAAGTVSLITSGGVEVSRITLTAGGAAVTVVINGTGFTSDPTYGHTGITNDVGVSRTATLITIQVKAALAVPRGLYSLTVAGMVIPDFFSVV